MKPVEIEFLMRDNLTAGLDKSKMSVEQLLGQLDVLRSLSMLRSTTSIR